MFPVPKGINPSSTVQSFAIQTGFSQNTTLVPTLNNGVSFIANLNNPFPNGVMPASGSSLGVGTFLGQAISFYNPEMPTPYSMMWNYNIQTMLPGGVLMEVGYTGTRSLKLPLNRNIDAIPDQYLSTSPVRDQNTINYLTAQVTNPFAGLLPGTSLNGSTIARSQLLSLYPQFTSVTMIDYQGWSWYNALQARFDRRFSNGFSVIGGYTFSKNIDATTYLNAGDPVPTRAISAIDRPQQLSVAAMYDLPFGKGKAFRGGASRFLDTLVGGWRLAAVWEYQSGFPISFGDALLKPGMTLQDIALPSNQRTINEWFNTSAFVTSSALQLADNLQTFPIRLAGVRTGAYDSADASLLKNVTVHENQHLQLRFEAYNVFNHPSAFASPVTTPSNTAFSQITTLDCLPRQLQLGIKYLF